MIKPTLPANENERLQELLSLNLLDTEDEEAFDNIVKIASYVTGSPTSLISLVDSDRQWFKAKIGLDAQETSRDISFCGHSIHQDGLMLVEDALEDKRFFDNPLVTSGPRIRFYAGQPLITKNGFRIGTLCTIDTVPKTLNVDQRQILASLGKQVVQLFEARIHKINQASLSEVRESSFKKMMNLFSQVPTPIAFLEGPEHRYQFANDFYRTYFLGTKDYINKSVAELIPEVKEQGFVDILDKVYRTGESFSGREVKFKLRQADGGSREYYFNFIYDAVKDGNGSVTGILAAIFDVSELVNSRVSQEYAQEELDTALENAQMGTWHVDLISDKKTASKSCAKIFGKVPKGVEPYEFILSLIHPEDIDMIKESFREAVREEKSFFVEYRAIRSDGRMIWVFSKGNPQYDSNGKLVSMSGAMGDISELKRATIQLAQERHQLEQIFEFSPAAMAFWRGRDHIFERVNSKYQDIFGDRPLIGLPILEAIPELKGQGFAEMLSGVFQTGRPVIGKEVLARLKTSLDGELEDYFYDFSYLQIKDSEGQPYGVYDHAIDVTERVLARRKLEQAVDELRQERDLRERFVAALTHDLRTPLTAAKMSAQLLDRKLDIASQKLTRRIMNNMDRADYMIRDILDASKIKAGEKFSLNLKPCNMLEIAQEVVEDLTTVHGNRFQIHTHGRMDGIWDQEILQRILENIMNNAIKYGHLSSPITLKIDENNKKINVSVHNLGNPISIEDQKTLFVPYKRVEATSASQKGWGIGLTLVKGFAEAMKGNVSVASSEEEGTTFTIVLPLEVIG